MNPFESIRIALRALGANKLRTALTMLGIVIGVGSVITLMSVGRGAQASITAQIQSHERPTPASILALRALITSATARTVQTLARWAANPRMQPNTMATTSSVTNGLARDGLDRNGIL